MMSPRHRKELEYFRACLKEIEEIAADKSKTVDSKLYSIRVATRNAENCIAGWLADNPHLANPPTQ